MALESLIPGTATVEEVFAEITKTGVSKADAATLVGNWIVDNAGLRPHVFNYQTDFPGTDPDCASQFTRSFLHQDWVDGEDVVQAEQTTGEDGFNLRFRRIETDLDSIGRDLAEAFLCLAEQRAALRSLLDEIRTELNRINAAIGPPRPTFPPVVTGVGGGKPATFAGATTFFGKNVNVFETDQGTLLLPAVSGLNVSASDSARVNRVAEFASFLTDPRVTEFFSSQKRVSRDEFVAQFGDVRLDNGDTVRDVLDILPANARFASAKTMLDGLATREGAALRTSPGEADSIAQSLNLAGDVKVADAPVDRLDLIPSAGRIALAGAGVTSLGALASHDPGTLLRSLHARGVDATASEVAGWIGAAKTLVGVR